MQELCTIAYKITYNSLPFSQTSRQNDSMKAEIERQDAEKCWQNLTFWEPDETLHSAGIDVK